MTTIASNRVKAAHASQVRSTANRTQPLPAPAAQSVGLLGQCYLPDGWPPEVASPAEPDWQLSASNWLFDYCPPDYRAYPVLRRHPVVLARFCADFIEGQIRASRVALAKARTGLNDYVEPQVLDNAVEVLETELARLVHSRRAVALIEQALRGKVFIRKL